MLGRVLVLGLAVPALAEGLGQRVGLGVVQHRGPVHVEVAQVRGQVRGLVQGQGQGQGQVPVPVLVLVLPVPQTRTLLTWTSSSAATSLLCLCVAKCILPPLSALSLPFVCRLVGVIKGQKVFVPRREGGGYTNLPLCFRLVHTVHTNHTPPWLAIRVWA